MNRDHSLVMGFSKLLQLSLIVFLNNIACCTNICYELVSITMDYQVTPICISPRPIDVAHNINGSVLLRIQLESKARV